MRDLTKYVDVLYSASLIEPYNLVTAQLIAQRTANLQAVISNPSIISICRMFYPSVR